MKVRKLWLGGILVLVLFGFMVNRAQAQFPDLSGWEEKWFKLTVKNTGVFFDGSKLKTGNDNSTNYLYIKKFNSPSELVVKVWNQNDQGGWEVSVDNLSVKIIAGTELDFVFATTFESSDSSGTMYFGFAARITGRLTQGVLKSATLKSLGGFSWEMGNSGYFASGVSVNGSLTDRSKVPPTIQP